jgi:uncharacterized protein YdeI (YjbR/CyaY-like superfamily)
MLMIFQAALEPVNIAPFSTIVRIPFDPAVVWPQRVGLRIKGSIRPTTSAPKDALPLATSLIRHSDLGYFLLVTAKMRKAACLTLGQLVELTLEPALDERAATPPPELAKLLKQDRTVKRWFESLNYSMRKYIADTIAEPKSPGTRLRRAEEWMERILLVMDGEESPPPFLQAIFRRQPLSKAGWQAMTGNQRRLALLSVFTTKSPEAQAKRIERLLEDTMKVARRREKPLGEKRRAEQIAEDE